VPPAAALATEKTQEDTENHIFEPEFWIHVLDDAVVESFFRLSSASVE